MSSEDSAQKKNDEQQYGQVDNPGALNIVAALVTLLSCIMAVQFSNDKYDIWDGVLAALGIYICIKFRTEFSQDNRAFLLARVSFAVSLMIAFMTVTTLLYEPLAVCISGKLGNSIFDGEFLITFVLTIASWLAYHKPAQTA